MRTRIRDVMTSPAVTVSAGTPYKEIVATMAERRISAVPVVDDAGRVTGVVSETDLVLKEGRDDLERRPRLLQLPHARAERDKAAGQVARELMTSPAVTIEPDASIAEAVRLMHRRNVKRLSVVDPEGRSVGIVSRGDLLEVFRRSDDEIRREVIEEVIEGALWTAPGSFRVQVTDGVVHIAGDVERRSDVAVAERLIVHLEGVVGVRSELTYRVDDRRIPAEALRPGAAP